MKVVAEPVEPAYDRGVVAGAVLDDEGSDAYRRCVEPDRRPLTLDRLQRGIGTAERRCAAPLAS